MFNIKTKYIIVFLITFNIFFVEKAFSIMEVKFLHSNTHETIPGGPYNLTQIEMEWTMPDGYTKTQISKFVYAFAQSNAANLTTAAEIISYTGYNQDEDYIVPDDFPGDTFSIIIDIDDFFNENNNQYWFYVAAIGTGFPATNGNSVNCGAYQIDIIPPTNPYIQEINNNTTTNNPEITLLMSASKGVGGVFCVRYWFAGYSQKPTICSENDFPFEIKEELPDNDQGTYPKEYIIMAEFEDEAGNKSTTASYQIQYDPDIDVIQNIKIMKKVPTLSEW